jgi:hypothetical protein
LELEARHGHAIERRFKLSRLPAHPTLDQFQFTHHKSRQQVKNRLLHLLASQVDHSLVRKLKVYTEPTALLVD